MVEGRGRRFRTRWLLFFLFIFKESSLIELLSLRESIKEYFLLFLFFFWVGEIRNGMPSTSDPFRGRHFVS